LYLAYDSECVGPQVALVVGGFVLARAAEGLTRESSRDDINGAAPRLTVKGSGVVPDWEGRCCPIFLSSHEDFSAERIFFNRAYDSVTKQPCRLNSSTSASEKLQDI
jgi:hypothetical protein